MPGSGLSGAGGREGGEGVRSSSWRELGVERVLMLVVEEEREGGSESGSWRVGSGGFGIARGFLGVFCCNKLVLFQPRRVT